MKFISKLRDDRGFSGYTHALSGVAGALIFLTIIPLVSDIRFGFGSFWILVAFSVVVVGATLIPDLDNTSSTSRNSLGVLGIALSVVFRASSAFLQTVLRTRRDDPTPNPHRGFWHTGVSALLIGGIVYALSAISKELRIPVIGVDSYGDIFALFFVFLGIHLALEVFAKKFFKKIKSLLIVGEILAFIISAFLSILLLRLVGDQPSGFLWLAGAYTVGCLVHILGDCFTKYGAPIFFPITAFTKNKFWWNTRFAKMESGGDFEKTVVVMVLYVIIAISLIAFIGLNFSSFFH